MKTIYAAAFALIATTGIAAACPAYQHDGVRIGYTTGQDLYSPNAYQVTAGGGQSLRDCGFQNHGYVISRPDFEFRIDGLEQYGRLEIRAVGSHSGCDPVLLVNDAYGNWYFDDDSLGYPNSEVTIFNAASGVYDIWVGTFGGGTCAATLEMETWY